MKFRLKYLDVASDRRRLCVPIVFFIFLQKLSASSVFNVEIVTLGNINVFSLGSIPLIGPAIDLAVKEIRQNFGEIFNLTQTYLYDRSAVTCDEIDAISDNLLAKYFYQRKTETNMTAVIMPGCASSTIQSATLAQAWNIPIIFGAATTTTAFRNRTMFSNVIAAGYANAVPYVRFCINLLLKFKWKHIYILYDANGMSTYTLAAVTLAPILKTLKGTQIYLKQMNCSNNASIVTTLQDFQKTARVLMFAGHPDCFRRLMINAHTLDMTDGNYVYATLEADKGTLQFGTLDWQKNDEYDQIARKAYESVLVLTPFDEKTNFNTSLFENTLKTASLVNYGYQYGKNEQPSLVAKSMYECFHMFSTVLNDTISTAIRDGVTWNPRDGEDFTKRFLGRLFNLPTGSLFIDKAGERIQELGVNQLNASTGKFQAIIRQDKSTYALSPVVPVVWPIKWPPLDEPECGFSGTRNSCESNERIVIAEGSTSAVIILLLVFLGLGVRFWKIQSRLKDRSWNIPPTAFFDFPTQTPANHQINESTSKEFCSGSRKSCAGRYLGRKVWRKSLSLEEPLKENKATVILILKIRVLSHTNVCSLIGILQTSEIFSVVSEFCLRGSLRELICNENVSVDRSFKRSIIQDILKGLAYIHASPLNFHGNLSTQNCLLDKHFTIKIGETGYDRLFSSVSNNPKNYSNDSNTSKNSSNLVWIAPELRNNVAKPNASSDIYALGHILYCTLIDFDSNQTNLDESPPVLGELECHEVVKDLISQCWSTNFKLRPTILQFQSQYIKVMGRSRKTVIDSIIDRMKIYSNELENAVAERTMQLLLERNKCDEILLERLPKDVVESLRWGKTVHPESFESATISFSNLSGFSEFASNATPTDVVTLLNESHSLFDTIMSKFDAYKVETINDSYVVASGLPIRNGDKHAFEICRLALSTRKSIRYTFAYMEMKLQVGMHTGTCVAAVAGLKQPSYCLFGDTMNTASRMESSGEPDKIHLSQTTANLVRFCSEFSLTSRGSISVKGKGEMETFWLESSAKEFN